jgi:mgtE-like transporter
MDSRDVKESLFALSLVTVGNLVTGFVMGYSSGKIAILPAIILLIPSSIALRGNIYASLGSRLSSYLHTGKLSPRFELTPENTENITSSTFLLMVFSIINGIVAAQIAFFMGIATFQGAELTVLELSLDLITISALSGLLSAFLMIPSTFILAVGSYKYGWNPDNLTAPFITLFGDMITLPLVFASADIIFIASNWLKLFVLIILIILTVTLMLVNYHSGKKTRIARRVIRESFPVLFFCTALEIGTGTIIGSEIESFLVIAGLLTIIPSFLEDSGAMGGILTSRFASLLHLGILKPELKPPKEVLKTFALMHLIGLIIFSLIGLFGQGINLLMNIKTIPTLYLVAITVTAGQIMILLLGFMSYYFSILSFRKGLDPDNVGIPLITSFMDVLGIGCLVLTIKLFGVI